MQFEVVRNSHKKKIIIGVVVFVAVVGVLITKNSFAKYQTVKSFKIVDGVINYTYNPADFEMIAMYQQKDGAECTTANDINCYGSITSMPTASNYIINTSNSYCSVNGVKDTTAELYTNEKRQHVISNLKSGSKCYLYFDKFTGITGAELLAEIKSSANTGIPNFSKTATTDEGVFNAKDESGNDSYYFRGAVINNYVKFANKYWRIIRINGDGSIRMIYDGTSPRANGTASEATQTGKLVFNSNSNNNMYVGFMYTSGSVHGLGTKSTILSSTEAVGLETWYKANLRKYESAIDMNAGFCGDRTPSSNENSINNYGGTDTDITYYGGYIRLKTNKSPSLDCPEEDFYTKKGSSKGNKALDYPIGLITADEVAMAGGVYNLSNTKYYLYTGQAYWTLSPHFVPNNGCAYVFCLHTDGQLTYYSSVDYWETGVRPVINLKVNTKFTGSGTMTDPYIVQ